MSEKIKIKISIGNRVYPLNILPEEEETLKKAVLEIEALAKKYEKQYAVKDKQDVLAMCTLKFALQLEDINNKLNVENTLIKNKISALSNLLSNEI